MAAPSPKVLPPPTTLDDWWGFLSFNLLAGYTHVVWHRVVPPIAIVTLWGLIVVAWLRHVLRSRRRRREVMQTAMHFDYLLCLECAYPLAPHAAVGEEELRCPECGAIGSAPEIQSAWVAAFNSKVTPFLPESTRVRILCAVILIALLGLIGYAVSTV